MKRLTIVIILLALFVFPVSSFAWPVPDTGQTKCYDSYDFDNEKEIPCPKEGEPFYGQDANYTINPMSYTKLDANGNDLPDDATKWVMVRDNVTGLIWEVKQNRDDVKDYSNPHDADNTYTRNDSDFGCYSDWCTPAEDFVNTLSASKFGGYSDWRLPTKQELRSIVDYNIPYPGPVINSEYFPNCISSVYWSSTTYSDNTGIVFVCHVVFSNGNGGYNPKSHSYYVRGVRGGQDRTYDHLVINGDGTMTDINTGLIWQQNSTDNPMNWPKALAYCENLTLGNNSDWRLPTIKELASLTDLTQVNIVYSSNTISSGYWSSTTNASYMGGAWSVLFNGDDYSENKSYGRYVRAVRGGQIESSSNLVIAQRPETCPPGIPITQWGIGFTPGGTATLHIFDESGTEVGTDTVTIRSDGSFEIIYTVPEDKALGTYTWHAVDETTGGKSNTVTYNISEEAFPEISTVPQHGTVETVFEQTGTNFTPSGTATLYFFDDSGNATGTKQITVEADGTFKEIYNPDDDKKLGRYYWYAVDETTGNQALEAEYWIEKAGYQEEPQPPADARPVTESGKEPMTPLQAAQGYLMEWDALDEKFYAFENNERYSFDADRPVTTILVHGWTTDDYTDLTEKKWVRHMALWLSQKARDKTNILAYNWLKDSNTGSKIIPPAIDVMEVNGQKLSKQLKEYLPSGYQGKLHFITHSAGSNVAHRAVNRLVKIFQIPVEQLTMLDAFMFDGESAINEILKPSFSALPGQNFVQAVVNLFEIVPTSEASFVDHYSTVVGGLSNIFAVNFWISNTVKGSGATFYDCSSISEMENALKYMGIYIKIDDLYKYKLSPEPDYFYSGWVDAQTHKPPVNWYMASMVDQLGVDGYQISGNAENHRYGYYWSPIYEDKHEHPQKSDVEFLIGFDCYFDLLGSSQVQTDLKMLARSTAVEIKEGWDTAVEKGHELKERIEDKAKKIGTKVKVKAVEVFTSSAQWVSSMSSNVSHSITGRYFWMKSGSPVALSTEYLFPSDASYMAFSYKVLQADEGDILDLYINDELVWSKIVDEDLNNDIVMSNWIDITNWSGQTVDLMFQIHSPDGLPIIIELYDMVFADLGNIEEVLKADTDNDGMGDMWEIHYFGNVEQDGSGDADNDGVPNSEEYSYRTNPSLTDTDNDGKSDLEEIRTGSDPLDDGTTTPPASSLFTATTGPDQTIKENTTVTLTSTTTSAQSPTYQWTQTAGPSVKLNSDNTATPTFTAPEIGPDDQYLTFQLTVTDSSGATATDSCTVTVYNDGPGDENDDNGCFIQTANH